LRHVERAFSQDEPQAETTCRYSVVPGRHGRPNVCSSAVTEQFCRPWQRRATTASEQADSHSTEALYRK